MALEVFRDLFNTTTDAAGGTVTRTGYGFQPKFALLWAVGSTESADTVNTTVHSKRCFGAAASSGLRWAAANNSVDAALSAVTDQMLRDDSCLVRLSTVGASAGRLDLNAFTTDGITFDIDEAFGTDIRVLCLAFGGNDITNVSAGTFTELGSTGSQSITTPGFLPSAAVFAGGNSTALNTNFGDSAFFVGAAASTTPTNAVTAGVSNDGENNMVTKGYSRAGESIAMFAAATTAINGRASVSQWTTSGFDLTWNESTAASRLVGYLTWAGGQWAVGDLLSSTSTGTITETGLAFQPSFGMFVSHCRAEDAADTLSNQDVVNIGMSHSTSAQASMGVRDRNAVGAAEVTTIIEHDSVYASVGTGTLDASISLASFTTQGFTLSQDDADPTASFIWYLTGASAAGASEQTVTTVAPEVTAEAPAPTVVATYDAATAAPKVTVEAPNTTVVATVTQQLAAAKVTVEAPTQAAALDNPIAQPVRVTVEAPAVTMLPELRVTPDVVVIPMSVGESLGISAETEAVPVAVVIQTVGIAWTPAAVPEVAIKAPTVSTDNSQTFALSNSAVAVKTAAATVVASVTLTSVATSATAIVRSVSAAAPDQFLAVSNTEVAIWAQAVTALVFGNPDALDDPLRALVEVTAYRALVDNSRYIAQVD